MTDAIELNDWTEVLDRKGERLPSLDELSYLCFHHWHKLSPVILRECIVQSEEIECVVSSEFMDQGIALVPFIFFPGRDELLVCFPAPRHMREQKVRAFYGTTPVALDIVCELVKDMTARLEHKIFEKSFS